MLKVQGWDNLSFTGAYDPSCKNVSTMSTMYISAQCEFADIPIASFPGWGICSINICTHFHKPGTRSPGREKRTNKIAERSARKRVRSRKYSKGVGERGPIPHYRHYNSLTVCSRFLAPFAQNGEPVHRLTFSTPTVHYGISRYHCIIYTASISLTVLGALQCTKTLKNLYI